jgi:stearoyl-CoA 9-desaturase NADPH oxidoreductase
MNGMVNIPASAAVGVRRAGLRRALREKATQVAEAALTPYKPADFLDLFHPLRPGADLRARIVDVRPETRDAATIMLRPGKGWAGHTPGQFLRIGIDVDGVRHWRAYSLTHGQRSDGHVAITVKAVPDGVVSSYLVHEAKPGTLVHLEQAAGEFVLPPDLHGKGARLLFITAGSGITPVIGMLRNLFPVTDDGVLKLRRSGALDVTIVHIAPSESDSIFIRDLRALADAGAINLVAHHTDQSGRFDVDDLQHVVPDLTERVTFACGPAGLLEAVEAHHSARGLPLFVERFRVGSVVVGEGGDLDFVGASAKSVEAPGDRPILDVAEEAGVLMPSGCRMGICMSCVIPLKEGAVRDLRNGELTVARPGETPSGGLKVQTCINAAAGPCTFDH